MDPNFAHVVIFLAGFVTGGALVGIVLWKIMLMGASRVVQQMIRQGYFMKGGFRYNVTLNRSGDQE